MSPAYGISETVSDKPKRGRPRVTDSAADGVFHLMFPDGRTRRNLLNKHYMLRAMGLVIGIPELAWFGDRAEIMAGRGKLHMTLLSELGRIEDDAALLGVALHICELKPRTREGVAMIRQFRRGEPAAHDVLRLTIFLLRAIDDYRARHRDCTLADCCVALKNAREDVESFHEEYGDERETEAKK